MKRSELTIIGEYRLTPDNWGDTSVMIDEDAVIEATADAFGINVDECDPDADPNNKPETVDLAVDVNGNHYVILRPFPAISWGHKTGEMYNENMYRPCEKLSDVSQGSLAIFGNSWQIFDDED